MQVKVECKSLTGGTGGGARINWVEGPVRQLDFEYRCRKWVLIGRYSTPKENSSEKVVCTSGGVGEKFGNVLIGLHDEENGHPLASMYTTPKKVCCIILSGKFGSIFN